MIIKIRELDKMYANEFSKWKTSSEFLYYFEIILDIIWVNTMKRGCDDQNGILNDENLTKCYMNWIY